MNSSEQQRSPVRHSSAKDSESPDPAAGLELGRRAFVIGAAGGAAALVASTASSASKSTPVRAIPSPVAVGYWVGCDDHLAGGSEEAVSARVVAADRAQADIAALQPRGAELSVHGLFGGAISPATEMLALDAHFLVNTDKGVEAIPFHVWSCHPGDAPRVSKSIRFTMPVNGRDGIRLSLTHRLHAAPTAASNVPRTHVGDCGLAHSGAVLRPGVYFFAVGDAVSGAATVWHNTVCLPDPDADGARRLMRRTLKGMKPVDFPYLIVSIAPVGAPARYVL